MPDKPNYFQEAVGLPYHKAFVLAAVIGSAAGLWRGSYVPLFVFGIAELIFLLVVPGLPGFRRRIDAQKAAEAAHVKAVDLDRIASKLSPNAKARLDGVVRQRQKILDALRTMSAPESMEREWRAKLDELVNAGLRLLVAVDGTRVDDRDVRFQDSELKELREAIAKLADGPAKAAKQQRLELLEKKAGGTGRLRDQREAAVTQFETLEDLLDELQAQALAGRDAAAFGQRLGQLSTQVEALGETVAALDKASETSSELNVLKAGP